MFEIKKKLYYDSCCVCLVKIYILVIVFIKVKNIYI